MPLVTHDTRRYVNNPAEASHQPTRQGERQRRRFKSPDPGAALSARPWRHSESVSTESAPNPCRAPSPAARTIVYGLGCCDGSIGQVLWASFCLELIKSTVPVGGILGRTEATGLGVFCGIRNACEDSEDMRAIVLEGGLASAGVTLSSDS